MPETISFTPIEEHQQGEPMSYDRFSNLLKAKFLLDRRLHVCDPSERPIIRRNIKELEGLLSEAPSEFMHEYIQKERMIG